VTEPQLSEGAKSLGQAFKRVREHKGLSQAEAASRAGMTEATVAKVEDGELHPLPLDTVFNLAIDGLDARLGEVGHLTDQYLGRT